MTARIVVLGSANVDLVVRQPRRAEPGETMFGTSFQTGPGGKGLNQAVAAARAGGDVAFIGAIGDDAFGAQLSEVLDAERIDTRGLRVTALPTGVAQITVTDDGPGIPAALQPEIFNRFVSDSFWLVPKNNISGVPVV